MLRKNNNSLLAVLTLMVIATMGIGCSTDSPLGSDQDTIGYQDEIQAAPGDLGNSEKFTFSYYGLVVRVVPDERILAMGRKELLVRVDKNAKAFFAPEGAEIQDIFGFLKEGMVLDLYGKAPRTSADMPVIELIKISKDRPDATYGNQL